MERNRVLILVVILELFGVAHGQGIAGSGGQLIGQLSGVVSSLTSNSSDIKDMIEMVQNGNIPSEFMSLANSVDLNCLKHLGMFASALSRQEQWALRMVDAIGKPPAGLMNYKLLWMGDWDECLATKAVVYRNESGEISTSYPFSGKYCPVKFPLPAPPVNGKKPKLVIGTCLPDTCGSSDVTILLRLLANNLPNNISIPEPEVQCKDKDIPLDGLATAVIVVCSIFLAIMSIATLYDVLYVNWLAKQNSRDEDEHQTIGDAKSDVYTVQTVKENGVHVTFMDEKDTVDKSFQPDTPAKIVYKQGPLEKLILSFSVFTNGTKLLNTQQPKGALTAVNGIRFISMSWVIVGHTYSWLGQEPTDNFAQFAVVALKKREFTPIINGTFSVDTFFVLSGLLLSYLSLKELKKVKGITNFKWGMYYFHRIWSCLEGAVRFPDGVSVKKCKCSVLLFLFCEFDERVDVVDVFCELFYVFLLLLGTYTPYMLLMMLSVSLRPYLANGPIWPHGGFERESCRRAWWTNILYINNVYSNGEFLTCFGWSWYLANDMQFYIISPLLLIPLFYSKILGTLACLTLLVGSAVSSGLISMYYELPPSTILDLSKSHAFMKYYYVKPWCRVGPYVVGLFTGYLLYRCKLKMRINRFVNVVTWLVSIVLGCLIIYGLYSPTFSSNPLTLKESALYNATARSVWGACVAWVIFACANGYGGPINHILSWKAFVPLGRLTYFAYLVHPILLTIHTNSMFSTVSVYEYGIIYIILGHMCMSYAMAFVLSLAFEAPMMALEKVVFGRGKKK